ncbi:fasciclin domain-containing protein [Cellulophaga sp. HaHaR_3_176]|uniref:fasciclin domain-containing protein n=1 Tax=Cellulophaga sp. HaHaR_3_176 TaxID=1942464 RepID=UPI001C1F6BF8|nr:fasciclin domain-containing protein [Cellulophaga sp. HaHaR_3_176]QWX83725.1 fasciclin domain-containing protein [Cellulophaga sp. HaHaR_3_176]
MKISKILKSISLAVVLIISTSSFAQDMSSKKDKKMDMDTKMVGGAEMFPSKDIVSNAINSKDHTTLVAAVKAADLVATLQGDGLFTVFAPTNAAFDKLPKGTVESLLMMENKEKLQSVLTYHVLSGKFSAKDIVRAIKKGKGMAEFTTVNGAKITAMLDGKMVKLKDASGTVSTVTIADVNQSNGVIHVVDTVVLPRM